MAYGSLKLPTSGCVHFMYVDFFSGEAQAVISNLRDAGVKCVYTNYRTVEPGDLHIANAIARELNLQHVPYPPRTSPYQPEVWVPFLDDLITLSKQEKGIVVFIGSADMFDWSNRFVLSEPIGCRCSRR